MATASVPNPNFINGSAADADQVDANFAALVTFSNNSVVHRDGTRAMTAAFDAGGFKITNLSDGVASDDAVTMGQIANLPAALGKVAYGALTSDSGDIKTTRTLQWTASWTAVAGRLYRISWFEPECRLPEPNPGIAYGAMNMTIHPTSIGTSAITTAQFLSVPADLAGGTKVRIAPTVTAIVAPSAGAVTYVGAAQATVSDSGPFDGVDFARGTGIGAYYLVEDIGVA